ncbi:nitrate/sulfonate/bicarbonate ABC transporter ATP-binding protein [Oecophyllibacter saccharovorans]|nr:nitrate/sulfonate/bicarbonate ABC transporter ATP-binding protein [Oecophyllibacter saccharovorans]QDH15866.1 nitrate/sulfonate/bicarbonate ABC transporter ATP-binding protein [Oecophyllibacter saccharovorans]
MTSLLQLQNCVQPEGSQRGAEEKISLEVRSGEVLGLVGRSGSGKSSVLKLMSGLVPPAGGEIIWQNHRATADDFRKTALVRQRDVLFPWMTTARNVGMGACTIPLKRVDKKTLVTDCIATMDLDGYESAYPRELSPALQERAILARALVQQPELLLLDEPFLDLELVSAENLRTDLIELWNEKRLGKLQAIVLATHAIEEAVLMCDRILLFSGSPGRITHEIPVPFAHPRNREEPAFRRFVDQIYGLMTQRTPVVSEAMLGPAEAEGNPDVKDTPVLPDISIERLVGLLETVGNDFFSNRVDLPELAARLQMTLDDLLSSGEVLQLLGLAELEDGDLLLTTVGQNFVREDADARRDIMRGALLQTVPLLRGIRHALDEKPVQGVEAERFRQQLATVMSQENACQTLNTAITWGRYTGLFSYDEKSDRFFLNSET